MEQDRSILVMLLFFQMYLPFVENIATKKFLQNCLLCEKYFSQVKKNNF